MGKIIKNLKVKAQMKGDEVLANIRSKNLGRWCEVCGVTDPIDIDYDNPFVKIEWLLSDPGWLHSIKSEKGREEFKQRLNDPLAWYIFCHYRDEETGDRYWDLTRNTLSYEMEHRYKRMRKRKNAKKIEKGVDPV